MKKPKVAKNQKKSAPKGRTTAAKVKKVAKKVLARMKPKTTKAKAQKTTARTPAPKKPVPPKAKEPEVKKLELKEPEPLRAKLAPQEETEPILIPHRAKRDPNDIPEEPLYEEPEIANDWRGAFAEPAPVGWKSGRHPTPG